MNQAIAPVDYSKLTSKSEAPDHAFAFAGEFKLSPREPNADSKSRPVKILARTPDVVNHYYWGRCVHDFSGMTRPDVLRLDWKHDDEQCVGTAAKHTVDDKGLWLDGTIESLEDGDRAEKIMREADADRPFEASISFDPFSCVVEYVPEGMSAEVNNGTFDGPGVIFRQWRLRATAICPYGYDPGSQAKFSADNVPAASSPFLWKESPAMTKTAETTSQQTTAAGDTVDTAKLVAQTTDDARAQFQAELGRFNTVFGDKGPGYFSQNMKFEAAAIKHIGDLTAQLTAEKTARSEAEARLASAAGNFGANAVNTGTPAETQTPKAVGSFTQARTQAAAAKKAA